MREYESNGIQNVVCVCVNVVESQVVNDVNLGGYIVTGSDF